jgi:hypothetical protein
MFGTVHLYFICCRRFRRSAVERARRAMLREQAEDGWAREGLRPRASTS